MLRGTPEDMLRFWDFPNFQSNRQREIKRNKEKNYNC